ncbi:LAFE_0H02652g1_1 [Lachancea fermentati]|uniref:LAFE_0H02652g1_1 n=1 Tax=Lachancea fermentati TaxID=4955 RepID=A0A1G4MJF3_LACFM|nr:LAFE_0H02652g1_1 [Lachancea fermentati]
MPTSVPIPTDVINWEILSEIVSMDEDNPDFSKELIIQYIDQAETTFAHIEAELDGSCDLTQLASLGHFLRGSSAALGLQRIAWACERIQNYGRKREGVVSGQEDDAHFAGLIRQTLEQARLEFAAVRRELSKFYHTQL